MFSKNILRAILITIEVISLQVYTGVLAESSNFEQVQLTF